MIKVSIEKKLNLSTEATWSLLTNIEEYPRYVRYVRSVEISGPLKEGKEWFDWTSIVWIPMRVKHKTTKMIKNRKLAYEVPLPLGGKMFQSIDLSADNASTLVRGKIDFDLGNPVFNFFIGPILKLRLQSMMTSTLDKVAG